MLQKRVLIGWNWVFYVFCQNIENITITLYKTRSAKLTAGMKRSHVLNFLCRSSMNLHKPFWVIHFTENTEVNITCCQNRGRGVIQRILYCTVISDTDLTNKLWSVRQYITFQCNLLFFETSIQLSKSKKIQNLFKSRHFCSQTKELAKGTPLDGICEESD